MDLEAIKARHAKPWSGHTELIQRYGESKEDMDSLIEAVENLNLVLRDTNSRRDELQGEVNRLAGDVGRLKTALEEIAKRQPHNSIEYGECYTCNDIIEDAQIALGVK